MPTDLSITDFIVIPGDEFAVTAVRSSGPGGQNVNKVNSKIVFKWDIRQSEALPEDWRQRIIARYGRRISAEGMFVLTSQRHRDQNRNLEDCRDKLKDLVLAVRYPPTPRKKTRPSRAAQQRRLDSKRKRSSTKQRRRFRPED